MLETIVGHLSNPLIPVALQGALPADLTGTLYVGYPVLTATDRAVTADALLCSRERGVVAFDFGSTEDLEQVRDRQNDLHAALFQKFFAIKELRAGRTDLSFPVNVITVEPGSNRLIVDNEFILSDEHRIR